MFLIKSKHQNTNNLDQHSNDFEFYHCHQLLDNLFLNMYFENQQEISMKNRQDFLLNAVIPVEQHHRLLVQVEEKICQLKRDLKNVFLIQYKFQ